MVCVVLFTVIRMWGGAGGCAFVVDVGLASLAGGELVACDCGCVSESDVAVLGVCASEFGVAVLGAWDSEPGVAVLGVWDSEPVWALAGKTSIAATAARVRKRQSLRKGDTRIWCPVAHNQRSVG
jgi:hypothetical protein